MRLFVRYDRTGTIRSAAKMEVLSERLEHPYTLLEEGLAVLEAEVTEELEKLAPGEICERFAVDPQRRKLVPKDGSRRAARLRRSGESKTPRGV